MSDLPDLVIMGRGSEEQVLGAMLLWPAAIDDVVGILRGRDFASPRHELIFDAILSLVADGQPVDSVSVGDRLGKDLRRAGGRGYLAQLITRPDVIPSAAVYHARRVHDVARKRKVVEVCTRTIQMMEEDGDTDDYVNAAVEQITGLAEQDVPEAPIEVAAHEAMASLDRPLGLPTPWTALTDAIGGWAPGMLYVLGARPSVGKTVLGIGALLDVARRSRDHTALGFSMEMPRDELLMRMFSSIASVDNAFITRRNIGPADYRSLAEASAQVSRLPLVIDERTHLSLAQIRARIASEKRKRPVGLVMVDYLNLIRPADLRADRRVQVDGIAQGLKNLARDERVPILALAQLNRGVEGRSGRMPVLSDLRESGGIEAAADVVALMHRPLVEADGDPEDLTIWLAKNRHGAQTGFHLRFEGCYSRATDRPWSPRLAIVNGDSDPDPRVKD